MTPKQLFITDKLRAEQIAIAAGTTFSNFQQIAMYGGSVSPALAKRLADSSDGKMTVVEILYQSDYEQAS